MSRFGAYLRSVSALLLPAALVLSLLTPYSRAILDMGGQSRWISALLALTGVLTFCIEVRWAKILVRLIGARGDVVKLRALDADPGERGRRQRRKFRLAAIGVSTFVALVLAEIALRLLDVNRVSKRSQSTVHAIDQERNSLGIREAWDDLSKDDPRLRVVFLGDSIVWGLGVGREETFCHLAGQEVANDLPRGVITINFGEIGTGPKSQFERFGSLIERYKPQVVVHVIYLNDLGMQVYPLLSEIYRIRDDQLWLGRYSYVVRLFEKEVRNRLALRWAIQFMHGGATQQQRDQAWEDLYAGVRPVRDLVHRYGGFYCLTLMPWLWRLDDYPVRGEHERLADVARQLNVPYLELLPEFEGLDASTLRLSSEDEHPGPTAHRILAGRFVRFLREDVWPHVWQAENAELPVNASP